jgi:hypothetical protein
MLVMSGNFALLHRGHCDRGIIWQNASHIAQMPAFATLVFGLKTPLFSHSIQWTSQK